MARNHNRRTARRNWLRRSRFIGTAWYWNQPLVKRCLFLKSHWAANAISAQSPDMVRLQVGLVY